MLTRETISEGGKKAMIILKRLKRLCRSGIWRTRRQTFRHTQFAKPADFAPDSFFRVYYVHSHQRSGILLFEHMLPAGIGSACPSCPAMRPFLSKFGRTDGGPCFLVVTNEPPLICASKCQIFSNRPFLLIAERLPFLRSLSIRRCPLQKNHLLRCVCHGPRP